MTNALSQMMGALPPDRRTRLEARAEKLITLEYVRRSAAPTETGMARKLGVGPAAKPRRGNAQKPA